MSLEDKVAVVTGGSRGIGRAIVDALVAAGATVAIGARNERTLAIATTEIAEHAAAAGSPARDRVLGIPCDVSRYDDARRLIAETVAAFGRIDILVNNAGIGAFGHVADLSVDDWDAVIATNLSSLFYCAHEAIPHLRRAGGGWIINIGSLAGKNAFSGGAAYNASKFGLIGFSEALMEDVRHEGIRVSCIMPGSVATEFMSSEKSGRNWKILPEDVAQIVMDLLAFPDRTLPSRIEVRPARPPKR